MLLELKVESNQDQNMEQRNQKVKDVYGNTMEIRLKYDKYAVNMDLYKLTYFLNLLI